MQTIAIDTETLPFGPACMAPPLVVSSVTADGDPELFHVGEGPAVVRQLLEQACDGAVRLVGHNMAYDAAVYCAQWPELVPLVFEAYDADGITCTMVRQKLLDIAAGCYRGWANAQTGAWIKHGYGLDHLAKRHCDLEIDKGDYWRTRYGELVDVPVHRWTDAARSYAAGDSYATKLVYEAQEKAKPHPKILDDEYRQARAAFVLHLISAWGIRTDAEGVEMLRQSALEELAEVRPILLESGLLRRNNTRNLKAALARMAEIKPDGKKTETGRLSLDAEACLASGDDTLIALSRYTKAQNVLSTDVKAMEVGIDRPIHSRFDSLMETGRTSCIAKGTPIEVVRDVAEHPEGIPIEKVRAGDLVYAFDAMGDLVLRRVRWAGKTGRRKVVRLHWQGDGHRATGYLDLTPEHRVRLVTGEYCEARALRTGDRVLSLSRGTTQGYARLWATGVGEISREHRFIYEQTHGGCTPQHVHHRNGNCLDNRVDNLEGLSASQHTSLHSADPSPETRAARGAAVKRRWRDNRSQLLSRVPRGEECWNWLGLGKKWLIRELYRFRGSPVKLAKAHRLDYATLQKYLAANGVDFRGIARQYNAHGERITAAFVRRGRKLCQRLPAKVALQEIGLGWYRWAEVQQQHGYAVPFNHRVTRLETLDKPVDVYDIHVEQDHNFVAGGICVHNSSGPNLQNLKRRRGVRECYVPRPGYLFAACDIDKAELHTLAQVCKRVLGFTRLGDRLNAGFDPHLDVGAQLLGISYDEAVARRKDPAVKRARLHAKPANFGFPGGMGVDGFLTYAKGTYNISFAYEDAARLRQTWLDTWPEMDRYFQWINALLGQAGVATIVHLYSNRERGLVPYCVACNSFFQGLAADGAKAAMWAVAKGQYADPSSPLYGSRTVNFIHDELLVEVPEARAAECAHELQRVMVEAFNPWVPDYPVTAGVALMHRWSKDAEPVYNSDGELIPWTEAMAA